ncbi:hypothetical protein XPA_010250 [Xanthoria parietina]
MLHLNLPFLLLFLLTSPIFASAAITCLEVNSTAIATWTNARGQTCRWTGKVGGNFGVNAVNGGICGAGCAGFGLGNVYTQNCFNHDICSFFNNAAGGAADPNCGPAFRAAEDDTLFGYLYGCSARNPVVKAEVPGSGPVCG